MKVEEKMNGEEEGGHMCDLWLVKMDASHRLQLHSCTWFKITNIHQLIGTRNLDALSLG
jgi:hypothetical protein